MYEEKIRMEKETNNMIRREREDDESLKERQQKKYE